MIATTLVMEERAVEKFNCVRWTGYGELVIQQANQESLIIETHPELMPKIISEVNNGMLDLGQGGTWKDKLSYALETSLTRKPIYYRLTVKELSKLEIRGAGTISVLEISTDNLLLRARGANRVRFESLATKKLKVDLPVGGLVEMDGRVFEQWVSIKGPTSYRARSLKSDRARIEINGPGEAVLCVQDELDVAIYGLGSVKYIGSPRIQKRISGLGSLSKIG